MLQYVRASGKEVSPQRRSWTATSLQARVVSVALVSAPQMTLNVRTAQLHRDVRLGVPQVHVIENPRR